MGASLDRRHLSTCPLCGNILQRQCVCPLIPRGRSSAVMYNGSNVIKHLKKHEGGIYIYTKEPPGITSRCVFRIGFFLMTGLCVIRACMRSYTWLGLSLFQPHKINNDENVYKTELSYRNSIAMGLDETQKSTLRWKCSTMIISPSHGWKMACLMLL